MTKTTQCPACQTRFKVSDAQLSAASGFVRCGRCSHVFNALDHLLSSAPVSPSPAPTPPNPPQAEPVAVAPATVNSSPATATQTSTRSSMHSPSNIDDFELEVPDFDPMAATLPEPPEADPFDAKAPSQADIQAFQQALNQALHHPSADHTPARSPFEDEAPLKTQPPIQPISESEVPQAAVNGDHHRAPTAIVPPVEPMPAPPVNDVPFGSAADLKPPATRHRQSVLITVLVLLASLMGLLLLAAQLIYINRTPITAQAPETRPFFERLCQSLGCTVPYSTDQEYLRTEWSELSFVPEHTNLVQLSATLKNHAPYAQAWPMLEVTLKDADNQVLIRKVFTPQEYLKPDRQKQKRFDANAQERIVMRFDVGKIRAQGYSLYWFYP